ncbi:MAG: ferrous iron transport protein B [Pirellulaceae bacterium]|nr:ferrous iron transport protein B [Planctomycetales bacterium]
MPQAAPPAIRTIALIGNPNTGKSTLFSALVGVAQQVGNYPGVTVEKKIGRMQLANTPVDVVDLPGTYSLAPRSPDEMIAVDLLLGRLPGTVRPDAVICVVDASNLERNLFLVSQVLDLQLPTVLALNMTDVAESCGIRIDVRQLSTRVGAPIVELQAHKRIGLDALRSSLEIAMSSPIGERSTPFPPSFQQEVDRLQLQLGDTLPRYLVERVLLDTSGFLSQLPQVEALSGTDQVHAARQRLAEAGSPVPAVEAIARYQWVQQLVEGIVSRDSVQRISWTDRIDRVLTHRVLGLIAFCLMMLIVFQSVFSWSGPLQDLISSGFGRLGGWFSRVLPDGPLQSLIVDGVIGGVGGVLEFLPQIFFLFFFIALLEDVGYMARAAYLMDRLMSRVGLSGKSFIPLLSSFACAVPGIMATRVIENRRDRFVTILVAPLVTCSARLPVYALMTMLFVPDTSFLGGCITLKALTLVGLYFLGIAAAMSVAMILKRTLFRGDTPSFVMELPCYKWPSPRMVLYRMFDRGWAFVRRAGTLILSVSILVWAASYFPHDVSIDQRVRDEYAMALAQAEATGSAEQLEEVQSQVSNEIAQRHLNNSYLASVGRCLEPIVRPLGWDWRIGSAVVASFPAREVVIGTLGVIYSAGVDQDESSASLHEQLRQARWDDSGKPVYTLPVALSIMVFFALCAQCAATLAVIKRETNQWRWAVFAFVYMSTLAYVGAFLTYQIASLLLPTGSG